jgi:tryptophan-rich sensory protein
MLNKLYAKDRKYLLNLLSKSVSAFLAPPLNILIQMYAYKRLIGITGAVFFVLLFEWLCSVIVVTDTEWYIALNKPSFMLSGGYMTLAWVSVYGFIIALISRLIVARRFNPDGILLGIAAVFEILFTLTYFRFNNLPLSLIVMIATAIINYVALLLLSLKRPSDGLLFLPAVIWISYLLCLTTSLTVLN